MGGDLAMTYAALVAELSHERPFPSGAPAAITVTDFPRIFFVPQNSLSYRVIASPEEALAALTDGGAPAIVLSKIDIARSTIEKPLQCKYWIFGGAVDMRRATLKARADFSDATFTAMFDAGDAVFGDALDMTKARFEREANFWKAVFEREALFRFARFHAIACFSGIRAKGDFAMSAAEVRGKTTFTSAVFLGDALLSESAFHAKADFSDALFHRWANFSETHFIAEADLVRTSFFSRASFENVTFDTWADFKQMKVAGIFDMNVAVFKSGSHFSEMTVNAYLRLNRITFHGYAGMQNITIGERGELSVSFSTFRERADISFRDDTVAGRINFRKVDFRERCEIPWDALAKRNAAAVTVMTDGKVDHARTVENLFTLKRTYETLGRHDDEKEVFYLYKVFERRARLREATEWFFLDLISRYFTSYTRVIAVIVCIWFTAATVYTAGSALPSLGIGGLIYNGGASLKDLAASSGYAPILFMFAKSLYFSMVSFTTIGYGDYNPTGLLTFIAALEGFSGMLLSSLLLVVVARRIVW